MSGLSPDQLRAEMKRRFEAMSQSEWCRLTGCHVSHVSEFMNGKRGAPGDMLDALNMEVRYVKKRRARQALSTPAEGGE